MWIILEKELKAYFLTPTGYIFTGVFLLLSGICFAIGNIAARSCDMLSMLSYMSYLWIIICPFLVMRLIAGEQYKNTDKLLFSSPCSFTGIITGKFLAAAAVMFLSVALTGIYAVIMNVIGTLYLPETMAGYMGFVLLGCSFISLDLFISSICKSPFSAVTLCIGANLFLWLADLILSAINNSDFDRIFSFFSLYRRFDRFSVGIVSFSDTVFYIVFTVLFLFMSVRVLDSRRWRGAK